MTSSTRGAQSRLTVFSVRGNCEPLTEPKYPVNRFSVNRNLRFGKTVNREPNRKNRLTGFSVRLTDFSVRFTVNRVKTSKKDFFVYLINSNINQILSLSFVILF